MKRALSVLLAIIMVMALSPFLSVNAAAKTPENSEQGAQGYGGNFKALATFGQQKDSDTGDPKQGEVIVQFKESDDADLSKSESETIEKIQTLAEKNNFEKTRAKVTIADGITVSGDEVWEFDDESKDDSLTVGVASSDSLSTEAIIKELQSEDIVEEVSPNFRRHAFAAGSDPYAEFQWALEDYPGVGAASEWSGGNTGDENSIVAVVDTGINYNHPDLQEQMWRNPYAPKLKGTCGFDFVNSDTDPADDNGHGSHCAGIVGAATNGVGIQGVSPKVTLMGLKVLDEDGSGFDADIIAAYNYISKAMDLGAPVVAINCSFGGGDYNEIMDAVMDKVGKKGAISVCAAGNEETDCDDEPSYPACNNSNYIISVAATKNSGGNAELVSFSNYGAESVDIAAPGTDILSTVCYDCFNPTLYRTDGDLLQECLNGSDESVQMILDPDLDPEHQCTNLDAEDIESDGAEGFYSDDGALKIQFNKEKTGTIGDKWQYFAIPYNLPEDIGEDEDVWLSLMARTIGPEELTFEQYFDDTYDKLLLMDVPRSYLEEGSELFSKGGEDIIYEYASDMVLVYGAEDYWTHLNMRMSASVGTVNASETGDSTDSRERALLIIGDSQAGDFTAYIDDIGISQCISDTSVFGQYDFYSGTSMASPCAAGAVALVAAADKDKEGYGPDMVIGDLLATANDNHALSSDSKKTISTGGTVDFNNKGAGFWIGINSITVDTDKDQITIGGRFDVGDAGNLVIKMKKKEDEQIVSEEDIVSSSSNQIVFRNHGWINNLVDITVEGTRDGRTKKAHRAGYLVDGKKKYETVEDAGGAVPYDAALATDGKLIYSAASSGDVISVLNPSKLDESSEEVAVFTKTMVQKYFASAAKDQLSDTAVYDFRFGDDLVLFGGNLYVKASFCEVAGSNESDDDEDWSNNSVTGSAKSEEEDDDRFQDATGAVYSEETALFCINVKTGKVTKLNTPAGFDMLSDSKLAYYNGSLYFLGGINESDNTFSSKVFKYNATKKNWTAAAAMPQGRAGGNVLQSGDKLIYTLGYNEMSDASDSDAAVPVNYMFNGKTWHQSSKSISPIPYSTTTRGNKEYIDVPGNVGICAGGLVYMGMPAADYGDTFVYNSGKDSFSSLNWNYLRDDDDLYLMQVGEKGFNGIAVGDKLIGCNEEGDTLVVKGAIKSGLLKISAGKASGGKITGTGTYMPGTPCTVKAIANPGYYVKSLTGAAGTKVMSKGLYSTFTATKNMTVKAAFAKTSVKCGNQFTVKAGKSVSLKASITPAAAAKQWKLAYKSSNTKIAHVSAKGVVRTIKKGRGKTVTIKVMLKGTSKVMKTVKVKIK